MRLLSELLARARLRGGFSWTLPRWKGLEASQSVPLIAWMNYHQHHVLGKQCRWMGRRALKNPLDAWIYQEILWEIRPDRIVEIGNKEGGSTHYLACLCDLLGTGEVVAVDLDHSRMELRHPRVHLVTGDCADGQTFRRVEALCSGRKTLIIHDADHSADAVLRDLRAYSKLVSPGSYFIVEDSVHGVAGFSQNGTHLPGSFARPDRRSPLQAIETFLEENPDFEADRSRERYVLTANCMGYLRRKAGAPS